MPECSTRRAETSRATAFSACGGTTLWQRRIRTTALHAGIQYVDLIDAQETLDEGEARVFVPPLKDRLTH
jgi:hypothetical protein